MRQEQASPRFPDLKRVEAAGRKGSILATSPVLVDKMSYRSGYNSLLKRRVADCVSDGESLVIKWIVPY